MLRSSTFRLAVLYAGLFAVSVSVLLGFIYWSTAGFMARQADATIRAEIQGFAERYRLTNLAGLVALIEERLAQAGSSDSIYLLTDARLQPLAGNLEGWPDADPGPDGWIDFDLGGPQARGPRPARARAFVLGGGFHLLVGRDVRVLVETHDLVLRALASGLGLTLLMAVIGGALVSRSTARRIEAINATSRAIMDGALDRRIDVDGSGDDFDRLAANLNHMLDRIQQLMDDVRRVSDNVAHDLRTPLTRLRARLEALGASPGAARAEVEAALAECDELLATFRSLLRIARVEAGERREGFAEVDLGAVLQDVADLYRPVAEERAQSLTVSVPRPSHVRGDRNLLFQAFANLVDNAVKHAPPGGEVCIGVHGDGAPRVTVRDTGPGIPPADRERVLGRFVRLETSRTTPGNGLGLSLVAAVARLHGADLRLGGEHGLEVDVTFPATEADAA